MGTESLTLAKVDLSLNSMQKALHLKGSQGDTEWNGAMCEQLCMLSGANPPQDKEKRKAVGNKARGVRKEQAAVKQYPT